VATKGKRSPKGQYRHRGDGNTVNKLTARKTWPRRSIESTQINITAKRNVGNGFRTINGSGRGFNCSKDAEGAGGKNLSSFGQEGVGRRFGHGSCEGDGNPRNIQPRDDQKKGGKVLDSGKKKKGGGVAPTSGVRWGHKNGGGGCDKQTQSVHSLTCRHRKAPKKTPYVEKKRRNLLPGRGTGQRDPRVIAGVRIRRRKGWVKTTEKPVRKRQRSNKKRTATGLWSHVEKNLSEGRGKGGIRNEQEKSITKFYQKR